MSPAYAGLPALRERIYLGIQLLESFAHTQLATSLCSQFDMESMQTLCLRIAVELLTPRTDGIRYGSVMFTLIL